MTAESFNAIRKERSMESIKVTPENLRKIASLVDDKAGEYYTEYQNLIKDVEELTSIDYRGDDATAFLEKVEGFEPEFNKMKELMYEYAEFLRDAATRYENEVQEAVNAVGRI